MVLSGCIVALFPIIVAFPKVLNKFTIAGHTDTTNQNESTRLSLHDRANALIISSHTGAHLVVYFVAEDAVVARFKL